MVTGEKMLAWWRGVFAGGFREKWGAERGFLMVRLWWIRGETWLQNALRLSAKNMPRWSNLFSPTKVYWVQTRLLWQRSFGVTRE
jgi:hypothetical protein